ncbi:hypothetical protein [Streptomyces phaeochromogenes]|uniref:hypothetical protein n=1 Tax=Streptomyces phaeochromogenes TaxID=1923 RepID=UPI00386762F5
MSLSKALLVLLEPYHCHSLQRAFDEKLGHDRPVAHGQVYSTMSHLVKNRLGEADGLESGARPEYERSALTESDREIVVRDGRPQNGERVA